VATRRRGYSALVLAGIFALAATFVATQSLFGDAMVGDFPLTLVVRKTFTIGAVVFSVYAVYALVAWYVTNRFDSKRRIHDGLNVIRFVFGVVALTGVLGVITEEWVGLLFSVGVVGVAITFALQQPILSLIGWFYIMVKRPFVVGDRVEVEGTRGDVIEVGFLATTLWEISGPLVSTGQPSGRVVTVPNAQVLTTQVMNDTTLFGHVWSELTLQVAYETDVQFARETMVAVASDYLGDDMARATRDYRRQLAETPVELTVDSGPTVNVFQRESWVELQLRFVTNSRGITRTRNELYGRILEELTKHPDRVQFPEGRTR
jgi:small-conductance mechanosensitive channel